MELGSDPRIPPNSIFIYYSSLNVECQLFSPVGMVNVGL